MGFYDIVKAAGVCCLGGCLNWKVLRETLQVWVCIVFHGDFENSHLLVTLTVRPSRRVLMPHEGWWNLMNLCWASMASGWSTKTLAKWSVLKTGKNDFIILNGELVRPNRRLHICNDIHFGCVPLDCKIGFTILFSVDNSVYLSHLKRQLNFPSKCLF